MAPLGEAICILLRSRRAEQEAKKNQVAILLHCAGPEAQDIYSNFVFANNDDDRDTNWEHVLTKFCDYCEPRKNEVFERYKFWQRDQREGETVDQWVNELRVLLSSCDYEEQKETTLRDIIVFGVANMRVKERLLREAGLTLAKALDICHAAEASKVQMRVMVTENQQSHDVNFLRKNKSVNRQGSKPPEGSTVTHKQHTQSHQGSNCGYCGSQHQPRKCPAYGVLCSKCHGKNYFAKVCRGGKYTKKVYQVETEHVDNNDDTVAATISLWGQ